jgi:uncharacterized protein
VSSSSRLRVALPRPRSQGTHALAVWVWILGMSLAALNATYMMLVESPPPRKTVIASGSQNGAYFHYAKKCAEEVQKEGLSVEVRETAGSVENPRLLGQEGSDVALAIVQSAWPAPRSYSTFMPWAACTASPCGSSTATTSGSIASDRCSILDRLQPERLRHGA